MKYKLMFIGLIAVGLHISSFAESNTEWLTSSSTRLCERNGGTMSVNRVCKGSWDVSKEVCRKLGGVLPSKKQLIQVQTYCKNQTEKSHMSCYDEKGFKVETYWSNEEQPHGYADTVLLLAEPILTTSAREKTMSSAIRCVRNQWITPTNSICTSNNGKLKKGACLAPWEDAKSICRLSGGSLASIEDLKAVIIECGGQSYSTGERSSNKNYRSCYKEKGFKWKHYWSNESSYGDDKAASVLFTNGDIGFGTISKYTGVRCVNIKK